MKNNAICAIIVVLATVVIAAPLSILADDSDADISIQDRINQTIINQGRTPLEQNMVGMNNAIYSIEEELGQLKEMYEKSIEHSVEIDDAFSDFKDDVVKKFKKEKREQSVRDWANGLSQLKSSLPGIAKMIKTLMEGGELDAAATAKTVVDAAVAVCSCFGPYGMMAGAVLEVLHTMFTIVMGGEGATSEISMMEDRLEQRMDIIQDKLSDIEDQINDVSDKIDLSTKQIIESTTKAVDDLDAKQYLRNFMLSGEGNFSYQSYKNHAYGTIEDNERSSTAYYAWLKYYSLLGQDDLVKTYYDLLYDSLIGGWEQFYDYIVGTGNSDSIVRAYYRTVTANPELIKTSGQSPQLATIMFAYDLYQTELFVDQLIQECNYYQFSSLVMENLDLFSVDGYDELPETQALRYVYDDSDRSKFVTYAQLGTIPGSIDKRLDDIKSQLISDLVFVLGTGSSYHVMSENGDVFMVRDNDAGTFGNLLSGQTVYLSTVPETVCLLFDLDVGGFSYDVNTTEIVDGVFQVGEHDDDLVATLKYGDDDIASLRFDVNVTDNFSGGDGTAGDPYLVGNANQFALIGNGLDKHYRLVTDIDFKGAAQNPIGYRVRDGGPAYDQFTGSLDGNGYTLSNLSVMGEKRCGVFAVIGPDGEVSNMTFRNVDVSSASYAAVSPHEVYAGVVAGNNHGTIKYCDIDGGSSVLIDIDNKVKNRDLTSYAGGVVGANHGIISCCTVEDTTVTADSKHDFGGDPVERNRNQTFVGGVCGFNQYIISHTVISDTVELKSVTKSTYNPTSLVYPHLTSYAGGVAGKTEGTDGLVEIESHIDVINDVLVQTVIDSKSIWWEDYRNCHSSAARYVPGITEIQEQFMVAGIDVDEFIAGSAAQHDISCKYLEDGTDVTERDTKYSAGDGSFNTDNLKFFRNGEEMDCTVVGIYGFDTYNTDRENDANRTVSVLLMSVINGMIEVFVEDIQVTVGHNCFTGDYEVQNLKEAYLLGGFTPASLIIVTEYDLSTRVYVIRGEQDGKYVCDVYEGGELVESGKALAYAIVNEDPSSAYGKQTVRVELDECTAEFEFDYMCDHGTNFLDPDGDYVHVPEKDKESTCTEYGYETYVCKHCGDEKHRYLPKTEHIPDYWRYDQHGNLVSNFESRIDTPATCEEDGMTKEVRCINCGAVLSPGEIIPKTGHEYVYFDENKHVCSHDSDHEEFHQYTVTESVRDVVNADGSVSKHLVYEYRCICTNPDGTPHTKVVVDDNEILDENLLLPTIMVSDGYVLAGGDTVAVYVQLLNNPGINAANFGIRYSHGLDLLLVQDGSLLKGSMVKDSLEVDHGYNFVWGNDTMYRGDGNLLKLVFRVSDAGVLGDKYEVSIVYAIGNGAQGGFGTSDGKQYFVTRAGTIEIVNHLPGDINNDKKVDLLDAIEIGRFVVGKTDSITEEYANVNLSRSSDGMSDVDIMDMVAILQNLVGGFGANLRAPGYEVILNPNDPGMETRSISVSVYDDDKNTYAKAGLRELTRDGYKFLGWFDRISGGNRIDLGDDVVFNTKQKTQMLYAQWELNTLKFEPNGATNGQMDPVYYSDSVDVPQMGYEKEYGVLFISDLKGIENETSVLNYDFVGWEGDNGVRYADLDAAVEDLRHGHYGEILLTAIWSDAPVVDTPQMKADGYCAVNWFLSSDYKVQLLPETNGSEILNASQYGDYYCLYAKHVPLTYDLTFDLGKRVYTKKIIPGNVDNRIYGCSIENGYDLSRISLECSGLTLKGWDVYYNRVYYDTFELDETVYYFEGLDTGSSVVIRPSWKVETYRITYHTDDGNLKDMGVMKYNPMLYTVPQLEDGEFELETPEYVHYPEFNRFVGWYTDVDLTVPVDLGALAANPKNVELYAKWDSCALNKLQDVSTVTAERIVIELGACTSDKTITLGKTVSEAYIIGENNSGYKLSMAVHGNPDQSTKVLLRNVNTTGCIWGDGVNDVVIDCEGSNTMRASGAASAAICGFDVMTFTGDGSLYIHGLDGSDGTSGRSYSEWGTNGYPGRPGVSANHVVLTKNGDEDRGPSLSIFGGNGGNGGNGADGADGKDYNGHWNTSDGHNRRNATGGGASGGNGGDGGRGGDGGKGGRACEVYSITVDYGSAKLIGGNSGNGGRGGHGGDGGDGQMAGGWWTTAGNGGNGGNGGRGGDSYKVLGISGSVERSGNVTVSYGSGSYGYGGWAGCAGLCGRHCDRDFCGDCGTWGNDGKDGYWGSYGSNGEVHYIS